MEYFVAIKKPQKLDIYVKIWNNFQDVWPLASYLICISISHV